ncbi:MAG TPA: hypothetical protein P5081_05350 [Phycisphaerae bacterium]|nr:hypothetical protein [Phycisphaerae bacterium]HRW52292.1 hypothetical protein [Phycisphaerae bacterium]
MRLRVLLCILIAVAALATRVDADVRICTYNLLQFSTSSLNGDTTRINAFKTVLSEIDPDILVVQEIANTSAVAFLRDQILNAAGGPGGNFGTPEHYISATFTDSSGNLDQALFYRDAAFEEVSGSYVNLNTSPRGTPRWRIRPISAASDSTDLYIYSMHLAATDATSRAAQTSTVRSHANGLPSGSNIFFVGDFNIDSSTEASYLNLIGVEADNDGRGFDPINRPGNWSGASSFADIHTQSPHNNNPGSPPGGVAGGLDDRFDFILISSGLQDAAGFDYIPGTYRAFGNDGNHFNQDINDSPVIPEGAAVADALHAASDHIPVMLHLTDPVTQATITLTPPTLLSFPDVLVSGLSAANLTVANTSTPPALDLTYSFDALPGFITPNGVFVAAAGAPGNVHGFALNSSSSGNKLGILQIDNDSGNASPTKTLLMSGTVFDHAIPSLTPVNQTTSGAIEFSGNGGVEERVVQIHNADFDMFLSVPLSVTDAEITNDASGRFSLVGFAPIGGVTDFADFTLRFDGVGAGPGVYTADLTFATADDSALDGTMALADITLSLSATIPGPVLGDFNLSGDVETGDIPGMVALLLDPNGATMDQKTIGDMNQDSVNDAKDLQLFIDAMTP